MMRGPTIGTELDSIVLSSKLLVYFSLGIIMYRNISMTGEMMIFNVLLKQVP